MPESASSPAYERVEAGASERAGGLGRFSLRTKGLLAFLGLIVYAVLVTAIVVRQRGDAQAQVEALNRLHASESSLARMNTLVLQAIATAERAALEESPGRRVQELSRERDALHAARRALAERLGPRAPTLEAVDALYLKAFADASPIRMVELARGLGATADRLSVLLEEIVKDEIAQTERLQALSHSVAVTALALGLLGLGLFGAVLILFFSRLVYDLNLLRCRAEQVVKGYRGAPLPVTRSDEVGSLMRAVNHMARDLAEREKQIALERQKYFHQEKMAAIGALAAGVAHEIGNPIAAISGVAQSIQAARRSGDCPNPGLECHPDIILDQAQRLAQIVREISDFARPRTMERELADLNGLVRATISLMRYDRRFMSIQLDLDLDERIPAASCVGDQIIQAVMNLMVNAADALEGVTDRRPRIVIGTGQRGREVVIHVEDNGCGMDASTRERATETFFTTKAEGRGTGLGLALCRSIAEGHGGRLEIDSAPGRGTRVAILLPADADQAA